MFPWVEMAEKKSMWAHFIALNLLHKHKYGFSIKSKQNCFYELPLQKKKNHVSSVYSITFTMLHFHNLCNSQSSYGDPCQHNGHDWAPQKTKATCTSNNKWATTAPHYMWCTLNESEKYSERERKKKLPTRNYEHSWKIGVTKHLRFTQG